MSLPNFDGVHELRLYYTVTISSRAIQHRCTMDVKLSGTPEVGTPWGDIPCSLKTGGTGTLETFVDNWTDLLLPRFNTASSLDTCELWRYDAEGSDAIWVSQIDISKAGTAGASPNPAFQVTWTARSLTGGIFKQILLETVDTNQNRDVYPAAASSANDLIEFLIGDDSCAVARDDAYLAIPIAFSGGQNENMWRKRFRE